MAQHQAERDEQAENDRCTDDQSFHRKTLRLRNCVADTVQTEKFAWTCQAAREASVTSEASR